MVRNLQITIHEAAHAVRRRLRGRPAGGDWDPTGSEYAGPEPTSPTGSEYAGPEPTSPTGSEYAGPEPTSPTGSEYAGPEPTSPQGGWWHAAGREAGCPPGVTVREGVAPVHACCCAAAPAAGQAAGDRPDVAPRDYSGFVIVRMRRGVQPAHRSLWEMANTLGLAGLDTLLGLPARQAVEDGLMEELPPAIGHSSRTWYEPSGVLVSRPLIEMPVRDCEDELHERSKVVADIQRLESDAAGSGPAPLHSLADYWRVDLRRHPDLVDDVVAGFRRLAQVDLAYRELAAVDPGLTSTAAAPGVSFVEDQGYLDAAPVGIGAAAAWDHLGQDAGKVQICDLEQGWDVDHAEVDKAVYGRLYFGANRALEDPQSREGDHGNAVLGQLAAQGHGPFGLEGVAARIGHFALTSHYLSASAKERNAQGALVDHPFAGTTGHVAAAIFNALDNPLPGTDGASALGEGAVLLLEVQRALLPTEIDAADFDAIRLAVSRGVTVVEAAGNGGRDLDRYLDPDTGRSLARGSTSFRDSGAVVVGASRAELPHDRAGFSNFGSRVDCFAWGENVTSCGYGDLAGAVRTEYYTNRFSGTSSAAPIVAGAAALVQSLYRKASPGSWIKPLSVRRVLADPANGTRQGPDVGGHIGVMPDLGAIVRSRLGLVPDVYLRRFVGDDGDRPEAAVELGSSPDVLVWVQSKTAAQQRFGDRLLHFNTPAPGRIVQPGADNWTYVRLFNRGGGPGHAEVELYASEAATMITPERWRSIGRVAAKEVPQGDVPVVAEPCQFKPASTVGAVAWPDGAAPAYSLLAVVRPPATADWEPQVLPPAPPYFDWSTFRRFLRGPRVAWRNAHRMVFDAGKAVTAGFYIAGAPDRGRTFDLEVIQRLPAGAAVELEVPKAFAQKVRQRQSWLGASWAQAAAPDWLRAELPARARLDLGGVLLGCGARVPAALRVTLPATASPTGHSLAIRQLWRGEEVGRITWWFISRTTPGVGELGAVEVGLDDPVDDRM